MEIKKLFIGAALLAVSSTSYAVNVGGVVWDAGSVFDFESKAGMYENIIDPLVVTGGNHTTSGFGRITEINSDLLVCNSCELTYEFGGFNLIYDGGFVDTANPGTGALVFTGGWLNVYVDSAENYDPLNNNATSANANDGDLWLSLVADSDLRLVDGVLMNGTLFGSLSAGILGSGQERGTGGGLMSVNGGMAEDNFDTDGELGFYGLSDFNFNSSFEPTRAAAVTAGALPMTGTTELVGRSIPEPISLALLGIGLLGMGAVRRRI